MATIEARRRDGSRLTLDPSARLVEVKSTWDPENVFRMNKNIALRG